MSIVNVKCPNCGASIQLDSDREEGFCSYCGSKVKVVTTQHPQGMRWSTGLVNNL